MLANVSGIDYLYENTDFRTIFIFFSPYYIVTLH